MCLPSTTSLRYFLPDREFKDLKYLGTGEIASMGPEFKAQHPWLKVGVLAYYNPIAGYMEISGSMGFSQPKLIRGPQVPVRDSLHRQGGQLVRMALELDIQCAQCPT